MREVVFCHDGDSIPLTFSLSKYIQTGLPHSYQKDNICMYSIIISIALNLKHFNFSIFTKMDLMYFIAFTLQTSVCK